jgi:hypothetical protein
MPLHPRVLRPTIISEATATPGTSFMLEMYDPFRSHLSFACLKFLFKLPYQAGWQDLKDLFRTAGNIIRADINIGVDGRPKGSGTVVFETAKDAQQAISASSFYSFLYRTPAKSSINACYQACTMVSIGTAVPWKFARSGYFYFSLRSMSR